MKTVIFDMDGVLVDSEPLHLEINMLVLQELNISISEDYFKSFVGRSNEYVWNKVIEQFNLSLNVDELYQRQLKINKKLVKERGYIPIPYVKELIIDLKNHGMLLAVASSSPKEYILDVTSQLGIQQYFDVLVSAQEVNKCKPAPDVFIRAYEKLNVKPKECMIFEDSTFGVQAAKAANVRCIGFINENSFNQDVSNADFQIESFKEVNYEYLKQLSTN